VDSCTKKRFRARKEGTKWQRIKEVETLKKHLIGEGLALSVKELESSCFGIK